MAPQLPSTQGTVDVETVQEAILEQAQAAAVSESHATDIADGEVMLDNTNLLSSEVEDELPPPAYGATYGEIRAEKDGLGTTAIVADDGRVNIRINQLNRRLSQIFAPDLSEYVQSARGDAPPINIDTSFLSEGTVGSPKPPPLNIVIQIVGTRGDVQPFIALGKVLKDTYGHRVRLATHPTFKGFVQGHGLEFFSIGGDPSRLMAYMVQNPGLMPGFRSVVGGDVGRRRRDVADYIQGCWRSCYQAGDGMPAGDHENDLAHRPFVADCIIANPPSFAHIHCAEKLGIPLHIMNPMPYSPTQAFPHPLANIQSTNADPQVTNYISYAMVEVLLWQGLGDIINRFRAKCLGLDPVSLIWAPTMIQRLKIPHTYCWSPALLPHPKDWGSHISIAGFFFLDPSSDYDPDLELRAFLAAGRPPVYIGFGSIVLSDPHAMVELIFEAARKTGQRVLVSKGWGMSTEELRIPSDLVDKVFVLGDVPHEWLFNHVSCVVHHGGAGTTAAGITAGRPTVVVPFFGDQHFWGAAVARSGAGPDPIPNKQLTAEKLADAITFCLTPEVLERAKEVATQIAQERGSETGAESFHGSLQADRLRCTITPSRAAVWRLKRTKVLLSAFAACTLANAKLVDFHDLKLFRPQEYDIDLGPVDPVSGLSMATIGAFSSAVVGFTTIPSETVKALQAPFKPSRRRSHLSTPKPGDGAGDVQADSKSNGMVSPPQNETSSKVQDSRGRALDPESPNSSSSKSPLRSNNEQDQSASKRDNTSRRRLGGRSDQPLSHQDKDMINLGGVSSDRGVVGVAKAALMSPLEAAIAITKGFHNAPRLWNDDTVRPQERVHDLKSGVIATGREFGFGMYDGISGLVTQPWHGARREGTSGFFKGLGKGLGGLATKPGAALFGIAGHFMKGVVKEVQNRLGSNVQNYIITSRVAQGYEEWMQSSEAEKQDVIDRWRLIQKDLKKKQKPEKTSRGSSRVRQQQNMEDRKAAHDMSTRPSDSEWDADKDDRVKQIDRQKEQSADTTASSKSGAGGTSGVQHPPAYDQAHLAGTTQSAFEARQYPQLGEKTAREKTEEEIVMEYVKKQSLLELQHQDKGEGRATVAKDRNDDDEDDEDMRKALEASMLEHDLYKEDYRGGRY